MHSYKDKWGHTEALGETKTPNALILDFSSPEPWENNFLSFKPASHGILLRQPYPVTTVIIKSHILNRIVKAIILPLHSSSFTTLWFLL